MCASAFSDILVSLWALCASKSSLFHKLVLESAPWCYGTVGWLVLNCRLDGIYSHLGKNSQWGMVWDRLTCGRVCWGTGCVMLTGVGRPRLKVGDTIPWVCLLGCVKKERVNWAHTRIPSFSACSWLWTWPTDSSSRSLGFPVVMDCNCEPEQSLYSPKVFLYFNFVF